MTLKQAIDEYQKVYPNADEDSIALLLALALTYNSDIVKNSMFLVFIGASGVGKSSLVNCLPKSMYNKMSTGSMHAFISAFEGGKGLLVGKTKAGILIPDFNSLCVDQWEFRNLNRIIVAADDDSQELVRRTGNGDASFTGKISLIGASTDTILTYEKIYQEMGRRFLYYRIGSTQNTFGALRSRRSQPTTESLKQITLSFRTYIDLNKIQDLPELQDEQRLFIQNLADFSVMIRNSAHTDKSGATIKKEDAINRFVRDYELLAKVLTYMGHPYHNILKNLAETAVPHNNYTVYEAFKLSQTQVKAELERSLNYLNKSTYHARKIIANAVELGIIKTLIDKDSRIVSYYLEPRFKTIMTWWYSI